MQRPSKLPAVSLPGRPTFFVPQGWPDLPDCLLHSIVDRLGSFRDLLGFAATCPSWRSAFSSYPSKSTFLTKLPPLLIQPHIRAQGPLLPCTSGCRELYPCKVVDPANRNAALRCWIPQDTLEKMTFIGSSYGKLIYYCNGYCRIIDVFTGDEVATPRLPSHAGCSKLHLAGILTAPLASPNSHLLVSTESFLLDLHVGNDSWSELQLPCQFVIDHFVELDGQLIVSNSYGRSYALQLAPQHGLQEIKTKPVGGRPVVGRLVVCGDMLLILSFGEFHRLDMSTEPATRVAVEKLGERALFVGAEAKSTALSCMSPELWGGRSDIVYFARTARPCEILQFSYDINFQVLKGMRCVEFHCTLRRTSSVPNYKTHITEDDVFHVGAALTAHLMEDKDLHATPRICCKLTRQRLVPVSLSILNTMPLFRVDNMFLSGVGCWAGPLGVAREILRTSMSQRPSEMERTGGNADGRRRGFSCTPNQI
uniref:DUF295 domain-containing protein n=1 Tax=Aegilops tauschii TaxID=37682 RepID=M8CPW4_AEGTA